MTSKMRDLQEVHQDNLNEQALMEDSIAKTNTHRNQ